MDHPRQPPRRLGQRLERSDQRPRRRSSKRRARSASCCKKGWRPKRTILLCAWDGEEPGLLGSTEWVETHADELQQKAVVYINTDSNGRGFLDVERLARSREPSSTRSPATVDGPGEEDLGRQARRSLQRIADAKTAEERKEARERANLRIGALGSGSDFTPFLQHLGVASLNLGLRRRRAAAASTTRSTTTSPGTRASPTPTSPTAARWPRRRARRCCAWPSGRAAVRVHGPGRPVVAVREGGPGPRQREARGDRRAQPPDRGGPVRRHRRPARALRRAEGRGARPLLRLLAARERLGLARRRPREPTRRRSHASASPRSRPIRARLAAVNACSPASSSRCLRAEGLPRRPWYRHYLYAPGFYTGYAVKTLPAVREAIEEKQWKDVPGGVTATAAAIENGARKIREAAKLLGQ